MKNLKNCILKDFNKENGKFFYSFEVTAKDDFEVDRAELKKCPLFVNITWIANYNLLCDKISESPVFKLAKGIDWTHVVNSLTCYQLNDHHIDEILMENVQSMTILRGDTVDHHQKFKFASELIREVRMRRNDITILAAGYPEKHPEAASFEEDLQHLKLKVDAGVDVIITQLTFSAEAFCKFVESCRRVGIPHDIPILPGLYIPRTFDELNRILKITNVPIPRHHFDDLKKLCDFEEKFQAHGISFTIKIIEDIQSNCTEFIRGFHFYTMNNLSMLKKLTKIVNFS